MKEFHIAELKNYSENAIQLIDIRDEGSVIYGMIPGAIHIAFSQFENDMEDCVGKLQKDKMIIVYCQRGEKSKDIASQLEDLGFDSYSLAGGYNAFLMDAIQTDDLEESRKKAEESIRKKFHKSLFSPFAKACKKYELIQDGDHIAVCISGGKDSMLMAKLFQEIQRHRQVKIGRASCRERV